MNFARKTGKTNESYDMEIILAKDELAIMKWIYERAKGFGKEDSYWANSMKEELGLSEERYQRAASFLCEVGFATTEKGRIDEPKKEEGEWIRLTGPGANAYRHIVSDAEWDVTPENLQQRPNT